MITPRRTASTFDDRREEMVEAVGTRTHVRKTQPRSHYVRSLRLIDSPASFGRRPPARSLAPLGSRPGSGTTPDLPIHFSDAKFGSRESRRSNQRGVLSRQSQVVVGRYRFRFFRAETRHATSEPFGSPSKPDAPKEVIQSIRTVAAGEPIPGVFSASRRPDRADPEVAESRSREPCYPPRVLPRAVMPAVPEWRVERLLARAWILITLAACGPPPESSKEEPDVLERGGSDHGAVRRRHGCDRPVVPAFQRHDRRVLLRRDDGCRRSALGLRRRRRSRRLSGAGGRARHGGDRRRGPVSAERRYRAHGPPLAQ